ncbi:MAG TPA: 4Fe-4S binding protein [Thermoanaerobacterales bacterium]|jgi:aryl-alcohol dehydrogenase-like predicted oxidoreductase|nr:4Fe-4S binding protein [Thermoanaerobacterales bacterium]
MIYNNLGNTNLKVSILCFGSLAISPLQTNLSLDEGADIILSAMYKGVNFIDTAEFYQNYEYIHRALKRCNKELIIATKSYEYSYEGMKKSVERARREIGKDQIDIFMLHEQETKMTLRGHRDALEYLIDAKAKGLIKAIGVSTHTIEVVEAAADMDEIQVIHPLINFKGIGIKDGNLHEMEEAIKKAYKKGKGIYAMKCLGGGNLINNKEKAFSYILSFPFIHSVAVGMKSVDEVLANVSIFEGRPVDKDIEDRIINKKRKLLVEDWCEGCGECVKHCNYNALRLIDGRSVVDANLCILCGYCAGYCPEFCIKII